jgi:serine/threonine protein kinase
MYSMRPEDSHARIDRIPLTRTYQKKIVGTMRTSRRHAPGTSPITVKSSPRVWRPSSHSDGGEPGVHVQPELSRRRVRSVAGMVAGMPNVSTGGEGSPHLPEDGGGRLLARRYRLLTEVGHGGMGTVWHAKDEVLGRDVAVKEVLLPRGLSEDEREIQHKRTFREARTAARLAHPAVVTVFDVVEEDDRPWIIMELIRAPSLDQVIRDEGRLPPRRAAEIGRQMLGALHTAHEAGVLHRDVKPSNVLVAPRDRAVLTDFGIATAAGDVTLTQTGLVMGSPAYIAPERAHGRTAGPASDLWALGITLYAMVEGASPYERPEPMASLIAVISVDPEPPEHAGALRQIIDGLLVKDPDERMTAHEAAALLDEAVSESAPTRQQTRPMPIPVAPSKPDPRPADTAADTSVDLVGDDALVRDKAGQDAAPATEQPAETAEPQPAAGDARDGVAATEPSEPSAPVDQETAADGSPVAAAPTSPVSRSRRGATALAIGAIALVAVLILAIVAWLSRGDDSKAGPDQRTPQSPGATPSQSASPTGGVPAGFRLYRDSTGFSLALPANWSAPERRTGGVFFYSPDRGTYIQIDQTSNPKPSALSDWQAAAKGGPGRFGGYREIRVAPVTKGEPQVDSTGKTAADWEFTWQSGSKRTHVLNRGLVMNGHGYAILLSAPDDDWKDTLEELEPVYASFKPAGT